MPRAPRICAQVGCPDTATNAGRCDQHQREAWAGSDRRATLPRNWDIIRRRILERDGHRCQIRDPGCTLLATECDHIGDRDDHRDENLRGACRHCHAHRSAMQGVEGRAAVAERSERPASTHPGLVEPLRVATA